MFDKPMQIRNSGPPGQVAGQVARVIEGPSACSERSGTYFGIITLQGLLLRCRVDLDLAQGGLELM